MSPGLGVLWVGAWAALVSVYDLRRRRIPNVLSLGGGLLASVWMGLYGSPLLGAEVSSAIWAALLALVLTLPGYAAGQLGAGDVKFLAAFGLMSGVTEILVVVAVGSLTAVMFALAQTRLAAFGWISAPARKRHLPMGLFFSLGIAVVMLRTL